MAKFFYANIEGSSSDPDRGANLYFYFEGKPTDKDILAAMKSERYSDSDDDDDWVPEWGIADNKVSKRANLVRVELFDMM